MVWFQCEDCGENLKKPKLLNHFRMCSANKLSCIDCGEMFGQQSVQAHTQCITEAEKYGPKGQGKVSNNPPAKANANSKQKPPVDTNVGLSSRPPWFCSLCNTNATSKQTLLLHAEGKKHGAKARAFYASKQPKETEGSTTPSTNEVTDDPQKAEPVDKKNETTPKEHDSSKASVLNSTETENEALTSKKKRKLQASDDGSAKSKSDDLSNGEVIQGKKAKKEEGGGMKKGKHIDTSTKNDSAEQPKKKIKWKKLISSALKSNSDGTMKMRKLEKAVLKSLQEDGINEDKDQVKENLIHKINSSSRFRLENKLVYLVVKS